MQRVNNIKALEGMIFIDNVIDIFYLIGKKVSVGVLVIFPDQKYFLVDSRYIDACSNITGVKTILAEKDTLREFLKEKNPSKIFVDEKKISYTRVKFLQQFVDAKILNFDQMDGLRVIKDKDEIEKMRASASLNARGCRHAIKFLKEGVTEKEVAWEYEKYCREHGGEELSFDTIVAFGENCAYPHYHTGDEKLKAGSPVLIDCGITMNSYTSDMTRSLFFKKESNMELYNKWKEYYDHVLACYNGALEKADIGIDFSVLDDVVQKYCKDNNEDKYLRHTLGHGLGLEVHEWPRVSYQVQDVEIAENMIFTIEPGLYVPGSFGIRHENSILMTNRGTEILTV